MKRHLIIDGNAVYEIDEDCMLRKRVDEEAENESCENDEYERYRQIYKENHKRTE